MTAKKNAQISATIPTEKAEALQDYRFANRLDKFADVLVEAVDLFIETKGLSVATAPAAPVAEAPAKGKA